MNSTKCKLEVHALTYSGEIVNQLIDIEIPEVFEANTVEIQYKTKSGIDILIQQRSIEEQIDEWLVENSFMRSIMHDNGYHTIIDFGVVLNSESYVLRPTSKSSYQEFMTFSEMLLSSNEETGLEKHTHKEFMHNFEAVARGMNSSIAKLTNREKFNIVLNALDLSMTSARVAYSNIYEILKGNIKKLDSTFLLEKS